MPKEVDLQSEAFEIPDTVEGATNLFFARGWTDGLPIIPPTEERVRAMLRYTDRDPDEVVGVLPPRQGEATVEKIAINAVMAGCQPEYLPVLIAAVEGIAETDFSLYMVLTATHGLSPLAMVNGPMVKELKINFGYNTLGEGIRSNATIGRAIQLIVWNIAGIPGRTNVDTHGAIVRYHHIMAENEDQNPWEPLHVERGFDAETSCVTVFGAEPPQHMDVMGSTTAQGVAISLANTMPGPACRCYQEFSEPLIVLCPSHAGTIANGGFSKADFKRFIYEHARLPLSKYDAEDFAKIAQWRNPKWYTNLPLDSTIPIAEKPDDITVVVSGGAGTHSLFIPQQVTVKSQTKPITFKDGTPVKSVKDFSKR